MNVESEIGSSVEYPSVFWIFCKMDWGSKLFFCLLRWRLLLLTEEVSESDLSITGIIRFSFRKIGVTC